MLIKIYSLLLSEFFFIKDNMRWISTNKPYRFLNNTCINKIKFLRMTTTNIFFSFDFPLKQFSQIFQPFVWWCFQINDYVDHAYFLSIIFTERSFTSNNSINLTRCSIVYDVFFVNAINILNIRNIIHIFANVLLIVKKMFFMCDWKSTISQRTSPIKGNNYSILWHSKSTATEDVRHTLGETLTKNLLFYGNLEFTVHSMSYYCSFRMMVPYLVRS